MLRPLVRDGRQEAQGQVQGLQHSPDRPAIYNNNNNLPLRSRSRLDRWEEQAPSGPQSPATLRHEPRRRVQPAVQLHQHGPLEEVPPTRLRPRDRGLIRKGKRLEARRGAALRRAARLLTNPAALLPSLSAAASKISWYQEVRLSRLG